MPSRNPHKLKIAIPAAEMSVGLPRAVIVCPHASFRITPLVTYSTKLITTPASRPPQMTLTRLVCDIASSCGRTAALCSLWVQLPRPVTRWANGEPAGDCRAAAGKDVFVDTEHGLTPRFVDKCATA